MVQIIRNDNGAKTWTYFRDFSTTRAKITSLSGLEKTSSEFKISKLCIQLENGRIFFFLNFLDVFYPFSITVCENVNRFERYIRRNNWPKKKKINNNDENNEMTQRRVNRNRAVRFSKHFRDWTKRARTRVYPTGTEKVSTCGSR